METIATIASLFNALIPFIIALIVLALVPLLIAWIVLKLSKGNSITVGKIVKWLIVILVLAVVVWGGLNVLVSSFGMSIR